PSWRYADVADGGVPKDMHGEDQEVTRCRRGGPSQRERGGAGAGRRRSLLDSLDRDRGRPALRAGEPRRQHRDAGDQPREGKHPAVTGRLRQTTRSDARDARDRTAVDLGTRRTDERHATSVCRLKAGGRWVTSP